MEFIENRFTTVEEIELLQKYILVHSYLYYHLDSSKVSDYRYDSNSRQLFAYKQKYPVDYAKARYSYAMKDFDGSTGFGFVEKLNEKDMKSVVLHAEIVLRF